MPCYLYLNIKLFIEIITSSLSIMFLVKSEICGSFFTVDFCPLRALKQDDSGISGSHSWVTWHVLFDLVRLFLIISVDLLPRFGFSEASNFSNKLFTSTASSTNKEKALVTMLIFNSIWYASEFKYLVFHLVV